MHQRSLRELSSSTTTNFNQTTRVLGSGPPGGSLSWPRSLGREAREAPWESVPWTMDTLRREQERAEQGE